MSRIGNRKLVIPAGVTVNVENNVVKVTGPKGELTTTLVNGISVKVEGNTLEVQRENDLFKPMHGTVNANINNMINGVTKGFKKELEIVGVGYRFALKGNVIVISAGYSHPVELEIPKGITAELPSNTELTLSGFDRELLGEFAANVRKVRQPEPYKGKGIRYKDEHIIRKEGKKAA
jgi:large subunit ribosomal protein L6